jgi:ubiquinone/menaquinone biosynthesis C-methylase UbiE
MRPVDYDDVASTYDQRFDRNRYEGVRSMLHEFLEDETPALDVAEVGCGTGHWLVDVTEDVGSIAGLDPSRRMLDIARRTAPNALLVRGRAEDLPWRNGSFDRVFCINALHHFGDVDAFFRDARRVLRPGGALMTIGLDPHTAVDRWWIYEYFPAALDADRLRYPSTATLRRSLEAAGFHETATRIAQHTPAEMPFALARERGFVDRRSTSQLTVISDDDFDAGMRRLAEERPMLRADLRLFATFGRVPLEV